MKRSILVELDLARTRERGLLGLMIRLCDFLDQEKRADVLIDYGLGLVTPQYEIKALPTHVIHVDEEAGEEGIPTGDFPEADILSEDEDPRVLRDTRDKVLERSDRR